MTRSAMTLAAHPPYSPDLAPPELCLFVHVKVLFQEESLESGEQLLSAIEHIFRFLEKPISQRFCLSG
jgi:hypothetical protein